MNKGVIVSLQRRRGGKTILNTEQHCAQLILSITLLACRWQQRVGFSCSDSTTALLSLNGDTLKILLNINELYLMDIHSRQWLDCQAGAVPDRANQNHPWSGCTRLMVLANKMITRWKLWLKHAKPQKYLKYSCKPQDLQPNNIYSQPA